MQITLEVTPVQGADPNQVAEAIFDFVCSVGENQDAVERFDALVYTVDGYDFRIRQ